MGGLVPFNRPFVAGKELNYIRDALKKDQLAGDGFFTKKCQQWLEQNLGTKKAFLTHSCTSALEMAAILADIRPGDEVIMPSYTFVSTANAFVLRGGVPVFVDIRSDTLNINEKLIEKAITHKTKAIVPVHYAGVGCNMTPILKVARKHQLLVIEDAAHGVKATYKGKELGTLGDFGALSFHETKNIISGEGGALLVNNAKFTKRAEIIWQKGTDRSRFLRGEVDKYTWKDIGSSFLPGELMAAFLWAQLEAANKITKKRLKLWNRYHQALERFEGPGSFSRPQIPVGCHHNGHSYFILCDSKKTQISYLEKLKNNKIHATFHYRPLHLSSFAKKSKFKFSCLKATKTVSDCLIRLPLYVGLTKQDQNKIIQIIKKLSVKNKNHK